MNRTKKAIATEPKEVKAMTCAEAVTRYPGTTERQINRLCLKGKRLLKEYGSKTDIPKQEASSALFGKRVGKYWYVSAEDLDRLFLPDYSESLNN